MADRPFEVRFTPLAYEDLGEIWSYIAEKLSSPQAAASLMNDIEEATAKLEQFPYLGGEAQDVYLASKGYRRLVVQNYLIFYLVDDANSRVIIMRVVYGAREYRDIL